MSLPQPQPATGESDRPTANEAAAAIWRSLLLPESALSHLRFTGDSDSAVNSSFRLGVAAQASIGLAGLSAATFHEMRTGVGQDVSVDARHAVISFHSEAWYTVNGKLPDGGVWDPIAGLYETKDGGFVRIHTNFPHHRSGILKILRIPEAPAPTKVEVQNALRAWDAVEFETEAANKGMCATALRTFGVWDAHPHAGILKGANPVRVIKIGEAPKRRVGLNVNKDGAYPLEGIRVLDLTRVIAGPVAGKALAAHGADVLLVTSPNLPSLPLLDTETSLGKRTTQLDLKTQEGQETLKGLVRDADVFLQAYRPGALGKLGFGPEEVVRMREGHEEGIVVAGLCAWGWEGPWSGRKGFDSLVQTATGFNDAEGKAYKEFVGGVGVAGSRVPRPLPMQAIDHAAGSLLALGINAALCRTITEGGSWEVRVSLAAVGQWIRSLGRLSPEEAFSVGKPFPERQVPPVEEIRELSVSWRKSEKVTGSGEREVEKMTAVRHAAVLEKTPIREGNRSEAPMGLNVHRAVWRGA
ncbi:hypothetical protein C0991_006506 [Blastosporella zonata]|nr:hypothetical protein C0991_006506 [Blastosporella zonata]